MRGIALIVLGAVFGTAYTLMSRALGTDGLADVALYVGTCLVASLVAFAVYVATIPQNRKR
jgi:uncharacterized membrane protein YjfL (UPF0719 family)